MRQTVLFGMLGALTFAAKVAMAPLANIEPVSLFVMLFAAVFGKKCLFPIYIYVAMEILIYGFGIWNAYYIYIWAVLVFAAWLMRRQTHPLLWAVLSGGFGLLFGFLCTPVNLIYGGISYAFAWWTSGILFDVTHCIGNFLLALLLFVPLRKLLARLYIQIKQ